MRTLFAVLFCSLFFTGCAIGPLAPPSAQQGLSIQGSVHGGQQPIKGAHVYLFAANTTGYGQPSVSSLNPSATGVATDAVGAYVTTDDSGSFSITGAYSCTPGTQLYLYGLGGNPGAGINTGSGLMAVLGECPASGSFLSSIPFITINEVSTVAAAYSMAGFATDATHVSSSGTALAKTGIANAFATAASLVNISTGAALSRTPNGTGNIYPEYYINTVANILAACINSTGGSSTPCTTLFSNALSGGSTGSIPTDTATAAINIAHNPGSNVAALYGLIPANVPFVPSSSFQPFSFTLSIQYSAGTSGPNSIAIDDAGNVWVTGFFGNVAKLSNSGTVLSGTNGYPIYSPRGGIAMDQNGNAWVGGGIDNNLYQISSSGTVSTYPLGSNYSCRSVAVDASGNPWCGMYDSSSGTGFLKKFSPSGTDLNFPNLAAVGSNGLALDPLGNAWTTDGNGHAYVTSTSTSQTTVLGFPTTSFAVDSAGAVWASRSDTNVTRFVYDAATQSYSASTFASPCVAQTATQLFPNPSTGQVLMDGSGSGWFMTTRGTACRMANDGTQMLPVTGYPFSGRFSGGLAIDSSGNVWFGNVDTGPLTKVVGAATPVVTPISLALRNNTLGSRP